jgi:hypothetical protein
VWVKVREQKEQIAPHQVYAAAAAAERREQHTIKHLNTQNSRSIINIFLPQKHTPAALIPTHAYFAQFYATFYKFLLITSVTF